MQFFKYKVFKQKLVILFLIISKVGYSKCQDSIKLSAFYPSINMNDTVINYAAPFAYYHRLCNTTKKRIHHSPEFLPFYGQFNSFISDYKAAIESDRELRKLVFNKVTRLDVNDYHLDTNLNERLSVILKNNKVVMLNEAHDYPYHRIVLSNWLPLLKANGFNTIAIETLKKDLDDVSAFNITAGFYTNEPIFASLIRKMLNNKFTLKHYDYFPNNQEDASNPNYRDSIEAENILAIIKTMPDSEKLFIYCGYAHISEDIIDNNDGSSQKWLGYYLKKLGNIDPFTINQVLYSEVSLSNEGINKSKINRTAILENGSQKLAEDANDMYLIEPNTSYKFGRPTWLAYDGAVISRFKMHITQQNSSFILIQAFDVKELYQNNINKTVPNDQVFLIKGNNHFALALKKGHKYKIVYRNDRNLIVKMSLYKA